MRSLLTALSVAAAFLAALALYVVSYDTRKLEQRVHAQERHLDRIESEIASAEAELAHLSRPERIEPLARAIGLAPAAPAQFIAADRLPRRPRTAPGLP